MVMDRKFKIHWQNWGGLYFPNPESSYKSELADQPNTNNLAGFKSMELDSICDVYNVTFSQEDRVRQIREIDRILMESYQYALAWGLSRTGDWRSIVSLWWYDPVKHASLVEALKNDASLPLDEVKIDYWRGYDPLAQH